MGRLRILNIINLGTPRRVGGGGTVVGAAAMLKKDGTPDMRYKVNRRK